MISRTTLAPLLLAAAPSLAIAVTTVADPTLSSLRSLETSASLHGLRAGAPVVRELAPIDRARMQQAERSSQGLEELRAGALTDRELMLIGVTILAVILLIIIL